MDLNKLLVLVVNDMVIFPNNEVRIEYDNKFDQPIINLVDNIEDNLMLIVNPIYSESDADLTSLPNYGVLGRLKLKMAVPNGKTRLIIEGVERVEIKNYTQEELFFKANYSEIDIPTSKEDKNYFTLLWNTLEKYINNVPYMSNAILTQLNKIDNLNDLCDLIASAINIDYEKKKTYITLIDPIERCKQLIKDMTESLKFIKLEQQIEEEVEKELNETQKEYFLREKIKLMQQELGEANSKEDEVVKLNKKLSKLKCPAKVKEKITSEISRYSSMNSNSPPIS